MPRKTAPRYYDPYKDLKESSYKNIKHTFANASEEFQKWFKKNYPNQNYDSFYSEEKQRIRSLFDTVQRQAKNVLLRAKKFAPIIKDLNEFNKLGFYPRDYFSKGKAGVSYARLYQLFGDRLQNIDAIDSKYFKAAKKYAAATKSKKQEYGFKTKLLEDSGIKKTKINLATFRGALNRIGIHENEIVPEGTGYGNRIVRDVKITNRGIESALAGATKYAAGIEVAGKRGSYIALMHLADRSAKTKVGELAYGSAELNSLLANKNSGAEKFRTTLSRHMDNIVKNYKGKEFYNINKNKKSIDQLRFKDALELKFGKSTGQIPLVQYIEKILNTEAELMGMATDGLITMRRLDPITFKRMEPAFNIRGMGKGTDIAETTILDIAKQSKEAGKRRYGPLSEELALTANIAFKEIQNTLTPKTIQPIIDKIAAAMKGGLQNKTYEEIMALASQCKTLKTSGMGQWKYGGRVKLQAGGNPCANVVEAVKKLPDEEFISLSKNTAIGDRVKNVFKGVLGTLGKFGPAAGKFGAIAAAGAIAQPLVKQFMNDDPSTYLTDPEQQEKMLLSMIEAQERKKPRSEILDWSLGGAELGATAAAVPGSVAMYKARRGLLERKIPKAGPISEAGLTAGDYIKRSGKGYGKLRAGAGVGLKLLSGMYTPAGLLAHEPLRIAQMRREGESWGEVAKSPTLWMGPAFADVMTRMATRGMRPGSTLSRALSLGMSRPMLKTISRRFGMPGLALSLGLSGYDQYQDYKKKRGFFARDEE